MARMDFDKIDRLSRAEALATTRLLRAARSVAARLADVMGADRSVDGEYYCEGGLLVERSTGEVVGNTRESALRFSAAVAAGLGTQIARELTERTAVADSATETLEMVLASGSLRAIGIATCG